MIPTRQSKAPSGTNQRRPCYDQLNLMLALFQRGWETVQVPDSINEQAPI